MPKKKENLDELEQLSVDELKAMGAEIKNLLATLEDDYRKANITEKSYNEVKKKNKAKLEKIKEILYNMGITEETEPEEEKTPAATPAPAPDGSPPPTRPAEASQTPQTPSPSMQPDQGGVSEAKFTAEIEKLRMLIDSMKESKSSADDKIMRLTESVGELRSLVYQREGISKDQDLKLQKLMEEVSEIKPEQIAKEFAKRDKTLASHDMKLEKLEFKTEDLIKTLGDIRALLKSIGGLENIATVNKEIAKKISAINEKSKKTERLSNKIEEIFVDLNKKMEDFFLYKAKQETIDELVKELMKSTDSLSIQLKDYVSKQDLESLKEDIASVGNRLGSMKNLMDMIIPIMKLKIPEKIQSLQKEKEDIETLLSSLEDSYRKGKISQEEFKEAKRKNQEKLDSTLRALQEEWKKFEAKEKLEEEKEDTHASRGKAEKKEENSEEARKQEAETKKANQKTEEPDKTQASPKNQPVKEKMAGRQSAAGGKGGGTAETNNSMLSELKESFEKGLITREAFEKTKKMLESMGVK
jgi:hypothetical protein